MIRRLSVVLRLIAIQTCAALILCPSSFAVETNEWFVRRSLSEFFTEAFDSMPGVSGKDIRLSLAKPSIDNLGLVESSLHRSMGELQIYRFDDSADADSVEFRLTVDVEALDFAYRSESDGMFKRGDLYRTLDIAARMSLFRGPTLEWQDVFVRRYEEPIEYASLEAVESRMSRLLWAETPPGPTQKYWEPAIVTAVVGGLVYLFFASR